MRWLGILLLGAALEAAPDPAPEPPRPLPGDEALAKARMGRKYGMLLRQIEVREDFERYGAFRDWGYHGTLTSYAGEKDIPAGHWVYVYPYWYVWRDGPGRRHETFAGDRAAAFPDNKAWKASAKPSWLLIEWSEPRKGAGLVVRQSAHPGALRRVTAYRLDGTPVVVWEGSDPLPPGSEPGLSVVPLRADFAFARVRLDFASDALAGRPEVDGVGMLDEFGTVRWSCAGHGSGDPDVPEIKVPRPVVIELPPWQAPFPPR